jgi:UPF0755 protein
VKRLFILIVVLALAAAGAGYVWLNKPLVLGKGGSNVALEIEPGTSPRAVAQSVQAVGIEVNPDLLYWWFRLSGQDRKIRAGNYEIPAGTSPKTASAC